MNNTVALLHFDESEIKDECGNTWTSYNGATISETNAKFGKGLQLNGNSQYIEMNNLTLGDKNFTIDGWAYINSSTGDWARIFEMYVNPTSDSDNILLSKYSSNNTVYLNSHGVNMHTTDNWINKLFHFAIVGEKNKKRITLYINGNKKGDMNFNFATRTYTTVRLGKSSWTSDAYLNGTIDEFRISDGIARWTSDFTPPVLPVGNEKTIKVTLNANGGTFESNGKEVLEQTIIQGNGVEIPKLFDETNGWYYEFTGWYTTKEGGDRVDSFSESGTYYAHWTDGVLYSLGYLNYALTGGMLCTWKNANTKETGIQSEGTLDDEEEVGFYYNCPRGDSYHYFAISTLTPINLDDVSAIKMRFSYYPHRSNYDYYQIILTKDKPLDCREDDFADPYYYIKDGSGYGYADYSSTIYGTNSAKGNEVKNEIGELNVSEIDGSYYVSILIGNVTGDEFWLHSLELEY